MKAKTKSKIFRRIIYEVTLPIMLPLRFLYNHALVIWAFKLKPNTLIFKEFGIRVVIPEENDKTLDDYVNVYAALELLNRHDKESLDLIKKYIRIIYLWTGENSGVFGWKRRSGCFYMGAGVCCLNLRLFPADMSGGKRAANIIGWLVYEASKVRFAGRLGTFFRLSDAVINACNDEYFRVAQKFSE